ncbi:MAG TPA: YdeI/OmpD-associated family protein [Candidatus Elarobacter sp.]|nr:YdeI/OmpD-associated family protein [Candidatus Elarobacter sp.]
MLEAGKRRPCCFSIVPLSLHKALKAAPAAKAQWSDLTPTARRDFISWIDAAEQPETRNRRIEKACAMLEAGKRRPSG